MKPSLLSVILLFLVTNSAFSQSGIEIQYSANKIEVGGQVQIVYNLVNLDAKKITTPTFPNFTVLSGPNKSSSVNISTINGHMTKSQTISYSYVLQADKEGKYNMPRFKVELNDGRNVESGVLQIEVVKAGSMPAQAQQRRQPNPYDPFSSFMDDPNDPFIAMFNQMQQQMQMPPQMQMPQTPQPPSSGKNSGIYADPSKINLKNDIFAKIIVDKSKCYVGEQINASVRIYTAVNSDGFEAEKLPNFNGFWSQEVKLPERLELKREQINGREFVSVEIKKVILFPTQAGKLEITPLKMKTVAQVPVRVSGNQKQPRDLFEAIEMMMNNQFGSGVEFKSIPYSFSSGSKVIDVLPLPNPVPPTFSGAVGKFNAQAFSDKKSLNTDDVFNYKIEINGQGNLPLIGVPKLIWNESLETFDPQMQEQYTELPIFSGTKSWNYSVIPHMPGKVSTPSYEFTYFDPESKGYKTIKTESTELVITGKPTAFKNNRQSDINTYANRPIKLDNKYAEVNNIPNSVFYVLTFMPLLLILGLAVAPKRDNTEARFISSKNISSRVRKQMQQAKKYMDEGNKTAFYNETTRAYWGYLEHKLKMETSSLNRENIEDELEKRHVKPETIKELIQLMDKSEMGLYTSQGQDDMQDLYDKSLDVLSDLDSQLA